MSGGDNLPVEPGESAGTSNILADLRATGEGPSEGQDLGSLTARPERRLGMQVLVIPLVLLLSGGALFLMRKQGMNAGMHFDRGVKIDDDVARVKPIAHSPEQQRILEELALYQDLRPAPAEKIQKNPFRLESRTADAGPGLAPLEDNSAAIRSALAGLTLNGIMQGPVPLARINGETVRVGDAIDKWFVVGQIHDRTVDLIAEGTTYTLSMGEVLPAGGRRPRGGSPPRP